MAFQSLVGLSSSALGIALASFTVLTAAFLYAFSRPALPKNVPPFTTEAWPIIGSMQFFTQRWDFFQRQMAHTPTGNFSFYAGDKPVIAISNEEGKVPFYENKHMSLAAGYGALLGGSPQINEGNSPLGEVEDQQQGWSNYFARRLAALLKGPLLAKGLPQLLVDVRAKLDGLAAQEQKMTDPFDSIYRIVFQLTMRTVACHEIAGDEVLREKVLHLFEAIEETATPLSIMYTWMPVPARFRRFYAGAKLYMIFKNIIDTRAKNGTREDDALQYLIDQGDDITKIITFVVGALFAGQLNSGINAAWILIFLSKNEHWHNIVREEMNTVANRYCADTSLSLTDRLMQVPIDAWENEFPMIDLCLKECIRLISCGTFFRQNTSSAPIPLNKTGTEVVPPNAYAAVAFAEIHHDPSIYKDPATWDPARYLPDRAEDKRKPYAWIGWGVGRHPCLGMRFAKLENNIIAAFWVARFESMEVVDAQGKPADMPPVNHNAHNAHKPAQKVFLKYKPREH
ncbi:hypothetical protein Q7P37_000669 [Cladosporium fusiforme]